MASPYHLILRLSMQKMVQVQGQLTQAVNKIGPLQRYNKRLERENTKLHQEFVKTREQIATDTR